MNHLPMFPQLFVHQFKLDLQSRGRHKPPVKRDLSFKQKAKRQGRRINLPKTSTENRQKQKTPRLENPGIRFFFKIILPWMY